MNIILLKHGTKYTAEDVNKQAVAIKKFTHHKIFCFTEDPKDVIIDCIDIPDKPKLMRWWNKMHLFRDNFPLDGKCVLFDLDIKIEKNPFPFFENIDWACPTLMHDYWKADLKYKAHAYDTELNSSTLAWTSYMNTYIWDLFSKNIDYYTRKYKGVDRFFWHEDIKWKTFNNDIYQSIKIT